MARGFDASSPPTLVGGVADREAGSSAGQSDLSVHRTAVARKTTTAKELKLRRFSITLLQLGQE